MTRSRTLITLLAVALTAGAARSAPTKAAEYPFPVPPLEIHERLVDLGVGTADPIPPADAKVLADFWKARTARPAQAIPQADDAAVTLHLLASGVPEKDRPAYLAKFNDLVAAAEKAVAGSKTDGDKADRLLRFLHRRVMAEGYSEGQTTLHGVFRTGKFNCVSSAALYFLVGSRLGLKLQPVLIPGEPYQVGHAAVDLVDGPARVQIEPTCPDGYDLPAKLKRPGVIVIGPQPDRRKAYDGDGFGLAAAAATNLGNAAGKAEPPRPADAVRLHAVALAVDPTDPTAANNLTATVSNWGLKAKNAKRYEDAVTLYAFGRAALGDTGNVEHNYHVVWEHYLDEAFGEGKVEDGLKLVKRAAAAFPKDKQFADPAEWVTRAAHRESRKGGWPAGLAFADAGLKHLTGDAAKRVVAWKSQARRQWSQELLKGGDADGSLKVLAAGLKDAPDDRELLDGLGFHTQEALAALGRKGTPAAAAHFQDVCEKFPNNKDVREAGFRHAARVAKGLTDARKFDEAMKAADACGPLAGDRACEVKAQVYDSWGRSLADDGKWEDALAKYAEGLKACPKDGRLGNNSVALVDRWASKPMQSKDWAEAIRIYNVGLTYFPDHQHLKHNLGYCDERRK